MHAVIFMIQCSGQTLVKSRSLNCKHYYYYYYYLSFVWGKGDGEDATSGWSEFKAWLSVFLVPPTHNVISSFLI